MASRYAADFKATYRDIAQFPGAGHPRPKLGAKIRIKIVSPYLIIYELRDDEATILRVLHGHRKITRKFVRR